MNEKKLYDFNSDDEYNKKTKELYLTKNSLLDEEKQVIKDYQSEINLLIQDTSIPQNIKDENIKEIKSLRCKQKVSESYNRIIYIRTAINQRQIRLESYRKNENKIKNEAGRTSQKLKDIQYDIEDTKRKIEKSLDKGKPAFGGTSTWVCPYKPEPLHKNPKIREIPQSN